MQQLTCKAYFDLYACLYIITKENELYFWWWHETTPIELTECILGLTVHLPLLQKRKHEEFTAPSLKLHEMIFSKRCLKQTLIIMIINNAQEKRNLLFQEEPHNLIFQGLLVNWHSSLMLTSCSSYICTIGDKIVETLYSNKVTSENKRIYTPPPSSPFKVRVFVVFYS